MLRDKKADDIFIHNFFRNSSHFFDSAQPVNEDAFMEGYTLVSHQWLCLREDIDSYSIRLFTKLQLNKKLLIFMSLGYNRIEKPGVEGV